MLLVNIAGLALIAFIVWWFWLYRPAGVSAEEGGLVIVVENGVYRPSRVRVPAHREVELHFLRKDPSPCAEMVLVPRLEISESLPLNEDKKLLLPPLEAGEYEFHCQMQMYRGVLKVE
jgi:plastocyanin domain-containing protein